MKTPSVTPARRRTAVVATVEYEGLEYNYSHELTVDVEDPQGAEVRSVSEVRAMGRDGYRAAVEGVVTSASFLYERARAFYNGVFIQDDTGGIFLSPVNEGLKLGDTLTVESFKLGDKVAVTGTSKGKGYAGTVKRWNFNESRNTHGFKGDIRKVGSIGSMYPQKVWKGKKMPGRMGHDTVTVKNLVVAFLDAEKNLIGLKGAVPGPKKGLVAVEGKE